MTLGEVEIVMRGHRSSDRFGVWVFVSSSGYIAIVVC